MTDRHRQANSSSTISPSTHAQGPPPMCAGPGQVAALHHGRGKARTTSLANADHQFCRPLPVTQHSRRKAVPSGSQQSRTSSGNVIPTTSLKAHGDSFWAPATQGLGSCYSGVGLPKLRSAHRATEKGATGSLVPLQGLGLSLGGPWDPEFSEKRGWRSGRVVE